MKPAHAHRPVQRRPKAREAATPVVAYAPGHFTEPVRRTSAACPDGFPPRWGSRWPADVAQYHPDHSEHSRRVREQCMALGIGWGSGTIPLARTPHLNRAPEWMRKAMQGGGG